jgi:hypothetical protein
MKIVLLMLMVLSAVPIATSAQTLCNPTIQRCG